MNFILIKVSSIAAYNFLPSLWQQMDSTVKKFNILRSNPIFDTL